MNRFYKVVLSGVVILSLPSGKQAAAQSEGIRAHLADDVIAVAYLDLSNVDVMGLLDWANELGLIFPEDRRDMLPYVEDVQRQFDELAEMGAGTVYWLFRVEDYQHGGPLWVIPVSKAENRTEVLGRLLLGLPEEMLREGIERPDLLPQHCEVFRGAVVGAFSHEQLQANKEQESEHTRDLTGALEQIGDVGLVLLGDADSRRVVREMMPALPPPFATIDGELLAEGVDWMGLSFALPPEPGAQFTLDGRDAEVATTFSQAITHGLNLLQAVPEIRSLVAEDELEALFESLTPKVEGTQVRISPDDFVQDVNRMAKVFGPTIQEILQNVSRHERMDKFKHLGLAFANHEVQKEQYPSSATYSEDGRPLLSWRVQLLPQLEQGALYAQFHHDEPWDSPHNRSLIAQMPEIYVDPHPALRRINAEGKTTFVVPTGPATIFDGKVGKANKDIIDGTSNTILVVEVAPEHAVIWTKPEDWEVDFDDPLAGLRRESRDWFTAAFVDGHARVIPTTINPATLNALITPSGREVIDADEYRRVMR